MQVLSRAFNDRPMTPKESVVYWTEYVFRFNGAPYSKALGTDMPLYKFLMLDIIGACSITLGVLALTIFIIIRKALVLVGKKSTAKDKKL